ncbi:AAA family ATPase [Lachnospiraceae bacterium MD308]|nr:AAA family ATPase [Lachnospiraceae bacterium MD308]
MELKTLEKLQDNISKVMIGNKGTMKLILTALLARGHVLLEDVPGTGKTVLAKSLARSVDAQFGRVQFTPDLLPSDVTGLNYFDTKEGEFVFREGPVFCNILLADEINRATPKTQSSLLECMAENQVTVDGVTRELGTLFFVIATQNPLETLGTFPLPEAQMDRFIMRISMEDLSQSQELSMIDRFLIEEPLPALASICEREELLKLQDLCREVYVHRDLMKYMVEVVHATRKHGKVIHGVSPRGTIAFVRAAQGFAMTEGRDYVVPEDIKSVAVPVLSHRLSLSAAAEGGKGEEKVIDEILKVTELPTEEWERR